MKKTMRLKINCNNVIVVFLGLFLAVACVKDRNFEPPELSCTSKLTANTTMAALKALYVDEVFQIQDDLVIEAYVVSSDHSGNFFGSIHLQDRAISPTEGLQLEVDLRDSYLFYEVGSKIFLKTKGLYLGMSKGSLKLGGVFSAFGNPSVGRLPSGIVRQHVFKACDSVTAIEPSIVHVSDLNDAMVSTLVALDNMQVVSEELGQTFAIKGEETIRVLANCEGAELELLNSGYSDFQDKLMPEGNGSVKGVLIKNNKKFQLVIRDTMDIAFSEKRCLDVVDEFSSTNIFISELADPDNNTGARFVELYNSATESLDLKGWRLNRYTNANTEVSATIDLTGYKIQGKSAFVLSPNAFEFLLVYGFMPDYVGVSNGSADSNGDDNLELVDPFGKVIDRFGVVGEKGSNTNHEFENGRAVRKDNIIMGNPIYTFSEWIIFNDTGEAGTTKQIKNAPEDFNPKVR